VHEVGRGISISFPFPAEGLKAQEEAFVKLEYHFRVDDIPFFYRKKGNTPPRALLSPHLAATLNIFARISG